MGGYWFSVLALIVALSPAVMLATTADGDYECNDDTLIAAFLPAEHNLSFKLPATLYHFSGTDSFQHFTRQTTNWSLRSPPSPVIFTFHRVCIPSLLEPNFCLVNPDFSAFINPNHLNTKGDHYV